MKKEFIIYALLMFFSLCSCFEDKGNYDYREVNAINIEGIEENYSLISFQDTLKITPVLNSTDENHELEYLWLMYPEMNEDLESFDLVDTISRERNLSYPLTLATGKYKLQYKVFNKTENNLMSYKTLMLTVATKFSEGFYLFKEDADGNSDIDMVTKDDIYMRNLLTQSMGHAMSGKPVSFSLYPSFFYMNEESNQIEFAKFVMPVSENDFAMIRLDDMVKIRSYENMFYGDVPNSKPKFFYPGYYVYGFVATDGLYVNSQSMSGWGDSKSAGYFGLPEVLDKQGYDIDNSSIIFNLNTLFFDKKNGRFIYSNHNGNFSLPSDDKDKFKCSNIKEELVYMGADAANSTSNGFAIFKDKDESLIMYLLKNVSKISNPVDTVYSISRESKLNNARLFCTNNSIKDVLYFTNNDKIYKYALTKAGDILENELKFDEFAYGEEITYINNVYFKSDNKDDAFDYLIVATYNAGKYKVFMYEMLAGNPYGKPKRILEGEGKVCKLQYVHPDVSNHADKRDMYTKMY